MGTKKISRWKICSWQLVKMEFKWTLPFYVFWYCWILNKTEWQQKHYLIFEKHFLQNLLLMNWSSVYLGPEQVLFWHKQIIHMNQQCITHYFGVHCDSLVRKLLKICQQHLLWGERVDLSWWLISGHRLGITEISGCGAMGHFIVMH